jgi:UDP-GlcNAc:undecaprenyl-phosphate GlcNAc-1-phosphate transferase
MYSLLFLGVVSCLLSFFLTPVVRNLFRRWGVVDRPGDRKTHKHPIPRVGGVAILLAYVLAFGCLLAVKLKAGLLVWSAFPRVIQLLPAAGLIFAIGILDDIIGLKPWQKLCGQIAASSLAFWAGVHVHAFGGHNFAPWWSFPLTIAWLVACTNAVNLIDGIDGLATGVGLFATTTTLLAALLQHNVELALVTVPLVGALLGFLRYNFNPASIFLGDSGSLLVGFLLGCFGVLWSQKAATILGMTAPLMALSMPLIDTALAIVRRFLRGKPIFEADRGHIHHRLLDRGLTPRRAALVLYACCSLGAIASLLMMNQNFSGFVILVFCVITWIGVQHLGYVEFGTVGRMFIEGAFRRTLSTQLALQTFEQRLSAAPTADDCWRIIEDSAKDFGFHTIDMRLAGHNYVYRNGGRPDRSWTVRIPISTHDFIELTREFGAQSQYAVLVPFADTLRKTLESKLPTLAAMSFSASSAPMR